MDFNSDYKSRLISLNLLPLMYILEINDLIFLVKSLLCQSCDSFNIHNYVKFCSSSTRLGTFHKLTHTLSHHHSSSHFYFNRIPRLWNSLPPNVIDLDKSLNDIRQSIKRFMWSHFLNNFVSSIPCTYHFLCPCSKCSHSQFSCNFMFK